MPRASNRSAPKKFTPMHVETGKHLCLTEGSTTDSRRRHCKSYGKRLRSMRFQIFAFKLPLAAIIPPGVGDPRSQNGLLMTGTDQGSHMVSDMLPHSSTSRANRRREMTLQESSRASGKKQPEIRLHQPSIRISSTSAEIPRLLFGCSRKSSGYSESSCLSLRCTRPRRSRNSFGFFAHNLPKGDKESAVP